MSKMASQITRLMIVYSTVYSSADQRKHQSSASLAFVRGIHRWLHRYCTLLSHWYVNAFHGIKHNLSNSRNLPDGEITPHPNSIGITKVYITMRWQPRTSHGLHQEMIWMIMGLGSNCQPLMHHWSSCHQLLTPNTTTLLECSPLLAEYWYLAKSLHKQWLPFTKLLGCWSMWRNRTQNGC